MAIIIDKRSRAALFRTRLREAMTVQQATQSGLARAIGVDRSTVSQLLTDDGARLPNAQVVAQCASELGVSADWLLGSGWPSRWEAISPSFLPATSNHHGLLLLSEE